VSSVSSGTAEVVGSVADVVGSVVSVVGSVSMSLVVSAVLDCVTRGSAAVVGLDASGLDYVWIPLFFVIMPTAKTSTKAMSTSRMT